MARSASSLLLLPPPPSPITAASLSAAYRPSISATMSILTESPGSTELLVVLPYPALHGRLQLPRCQIYDEVQKLLGGLYSLISVVCARLDVEVESDSPGSVDARVLLLDDRAIRHSPHESRNECVIAGPVIDLPTLATTRRRWNQIFAVDGEQGQELLARYSQLASRDSSPLAGHVNIVGGGFSLVRQESAEDRAFTHPSLSHTVVAVGGTFDHLHAGHKLLLTATALLLQPTSIASPVERRLIVGITGDELLKNKKYAEYLNSWDRRQQDVVDFLLSILSFTRWSSADAIQTRQFDEPVPNGKSVHTTLKSAFITIECVEIQDPFGPTISDESVTALVVSGETRSGGQAVNDRRLEKGWKRLEVFEVDVLDALEDEEGPGKGNNGFASKISSTEIRKRKAEARPGSSL